MLIISVIGLFWRSHCRFARREQSVFEIALAGVVLHHPRSAELAETSSSFRAALYSHQFQLGQFGRAVVWGADAKGGAPGSVCQCAGFSADHRRVFGGVE